MQSFFCFDTETHPYRALAAYSFLERLGRDPSLLAAPLRTAAVERAPKPTGGARKAVSDGADGGRGGRSAGSPSPGFLLLGRGNRLIEAILAATSPPAFCLACGCGRSGTYCILKSESNEPACRAAWGGETLLLSFMGRTRAVRHVDSPDRAGGRRGDLYCILTRSMHYWIHWQNCFTWIMFNKNVIVNS